MISTLLAFGKNAHKPDQKFLKPCGDDYSIHCDHIKNDAIIDIEQQQNGIKPTTLVQLVYVSKLCWLAKLDPKIFKRIESHSSKNNKTNSLTGILCYGNNFFYQCVEGEYQHVVSLRDKLCADKRHKSICIYALAPIKQRRYTDWRMKPVVLEAWQLGKAQREYLRPIRNYLPFKPLLWSQSEWDEFNDNILHFGQVSNQSILPRNSSSSMTHSILSKVAPHQAFLLVQVTLLALIIVSLIAFAFI